MNFKLFHLVLKQIIPHPTIFPEKILNILIRIMLNLYLNVKCRSFGGIIFPSGNMACDSMFLGLILCPLIILKMFFTSLYKSYMFPLTFNLRNLGRDYLLCTPILFHLL